MLLSHTEIYLVDRCFYPGKIIRVFMLAHLACVCARVCVWMYTWVVRLYVCTRIVWISNMKFVFDCSFYFYRISFVVIFFFSPSFLFTCVCVLCSVKHRYKCFIIFMCSTKVHKSFFTVLAIFPHPEKQSMRKEDSSQFQCPFKCNFSLLFIKILLLQLLQRKTASSNLLLFPILSLHFF